MVDDTFIASVLRDHLSSCDGVAKLIDAAKAAGGKDNISVVVCRILDQIQNDCDDASPKDKDTTIID